MISKPEIVQTEATTTAVIKFVIPKDQISEVMGSGIGEVISTVSAQGVGPAGPVYSRHFRMDPEVWDFEVGVPVTAPVTPAGRVIPSELPAARVARTVYGGSYDGLGDAWGEFTQWIEAEGLTPATDLWERYVAGPESSPDPAHWQTELNRPLTE